MTETPSGINPEERTSNEVITGTPSEAADSYLRHRSGRIRKRLPGVLDYTGQAMFGVGFVAGAATENIWVGASIVTAAVLTRIAGEIIERNGTEEKNNL